MSPPSRASAPHASRSPSICRASGSSSPRRPACPCCGGSRLSKLGEDVTETLEVIPRQWKVIQHVREKFSCRDCEKHQPGAGAVPCHPARLGRPQSPGDDRVREVRPASAAEPPGRALRQGRRAAEPVDPGRPGRRRLRRAASRSSSASKPMSSPPSGCMATTPRCRSWPRARPIPADVGPMSATTAPSAAQRRRRRCSIIHAIARGEHPQAHLASYAGHLPGRRLWRLRQALRSRARARPDHRGGVLGPCPPQVLRPGGHRDERPAQGARQAPSVVSPMALEAVRRIDALFEIERADQRPRRRGAHGRRTRN